MKHTDTKLVLIFEQGAKLRQVLTARSQKEIENFMKLFYDFPYYFQVIDLADLQSMSNSVKVVNKKDLNGCTHKRGETFNDCHFILSFEAKNLYPNIETITYIHYEDGCHYNKDGQYLGNISLQYFDDINELNECPECSGNAFNCDQCNASGVLNENL